MNGEIKKYTYIIATVCVVFFVVSIFMRILPWLLLATGIGYIVTKIVRFIKGKSKEKKSNNFEISKDDQNIQSADYTNEEVIDVEYEDVDSKKD